jgi:hypothetical protein
VSASGKLKALDGAMGPWEGPPRISELPPAEGSAYRVLAALPQIVAVVEAAETTYAGWLEGDFDWDVLVAALSALEEALT